MLDLVHGHLSMSPSRNSRKDFNTQNSSKEYQQNPSGPGLVEWHVWQGMGLRRREKAESILCNRGNNITVSPSGKNVGVQ